MTQESGSPQLQIKSWNNFETVHIRKTKSRINLKKVQNLTNTPKTVRK